MFHFAFGRCLLMFLWALIPPYHLYSCWIWLLYLRSQSSYACRFLASFWRTSQGLPGVTGEQMQSWLAFAGQHRNELERFITTTKIYLTASCHLTRFGLLVIQSKSVQFFSLRFMCILVISPLAFLAATMPAEQ